METVVAAVNGTGGSLASAAMEGVRKRMGDSSGEGGSGSGGFEMVRAFLERKQVRIPCVDVVVRL